MGCRDESWGEAGGYHQLGRAPWHQAQRQQWISVDPLVNPIGALLIGMFWWSTLPRRRLSAVKSGTNYNKILAWAPRPGELTTFAGQRIAPEPVGPLASV